MAITVYSVVEGRAYYRAYYSEGAHTSTCDAGVEGDRVS